MTAVYVVFLYSQTGIVARSIEFLSPVTLAHERWVQGDITVPYANVAHAPNLALALASLLTAVLLPAIVLCVLVYTRRRANGSLATRGFWQRNLAYFYVDYPPQCYYWDFVRMAHRIVLVLVFTLYSDDDVLKSQFALLTLAAYYTLQVRAAPLENVTVRRVEYFSGAVQAVTIVLLLCIQNDEYSQYQFVAAGAIGVLNAAFIVVAVYSILKSYTPKILRKIALNERVAALACMQKHLLAQRRRITAVRRWRVLRKIVNEVYFVRRCIGERVPIVSLLQERFQHANGDAAYDTKTGGRGKAYGSANNYLSQTTEASVGLLASTYAHVLHESDVHHQLQKNLTASLHKTVVQTNMAVSDSAYAPFRDALRVPLLQETINYQRQEYDDEEYQGDHTNGE